MRTVMMATMAAPKAQIAPTVMSGFISISSFIFARPVGQVLVSRGDFEPSNFTAKNRTQPRGQRSRRHFHRRGFVCMNRRAFV